MNAFARTFYAVVIGGLAVSAWPAAAQSQLADSASRPAGYQPRPGDPAAGEKLFNAPRLSSNGMSCASCHANNASFSDSFAQPYPHAVAMARDQLGRQTIHLDEMVQACMVMPMAAKPLPWNSKELADLTAYMAQLQKTFKARAPRRPDGRTAGG